MDKGLTTVLAHCVLMLTAAGVWAGFLLVGEAVIRFLDKRALVKKNREKEDWRRLVEEIKNESNNNR